jgi:antitoxin MazE
MQTQIQKWGNTLVVSIPEILAEKVHLQENSMVNISVMDDHLVIDFMEKRGSVMTLDMLLAGVTENNLHQEIETGSPVGNEVW